MLWRVLSRAVSLKVGETAAWAAKLDVHPIYRLAF